MDGKNLDIRPLVSTADQDAARALLPEGAPEPVWANCRVVERGGEIVALVGLQQVWRLEPLYLKNHDPLAALMAMTWADTVIRDLMKAPQYEFFVGDERKDFQEFVERRLPVRRARDKPGVFYFRDV